MTDALITGYERSYDTRYLARAEMLSREAVEKFYKKGTWYLSDDSVGAVADFDDRYYTSALSVMLDSLLKVAALSENLKYLTIVKKPWKQKVLYCRSIRLKSPSSRSSIFALKKAM